MKFIASLFVSIFLCFSVSAQDKLPAFGKIDKADLTMDTCSFDKDANAMYLIDKGEVNYDYSGAGIYMETEHWERIKILREGGIPNANIKMRYYSKDGAEEITKLEGYVFNLDSSTGNIITTRLEKTAFYNTPLNENYSTIAIAFPNVKSGTVIEYRYKSSRKNNPNISPWIFQKAIPSRYSEYKVYLPPYFEYTVLTTRRQPMETNTGNNNSGGNIYIMRNIPALKLESHMANFKDYLQRVDFQLSAIVRGGLRLDVTTTWDKITDDLLTRENFGGQLKKNIPNTADLDAQLQPVKNEVDRMNIVYQYVQKNMESNNERIFFSPNGIVNAWDKKRGAVGEINLILINLLQKAGVNVYPVLVSTKENGHLNVVYPSAAQFNEVLAYVPINGKEYILNAADKYSSYNLIPYDVQSTRGLVVDRQKSLSWIVIQDETQKLHNTVSLQGTMDTTGKILGNAIVKSYGYAKSIHLAAYKKGSIKSRFSHQGIKADRVAVTGADNDTLPLQQKITFSGTLEKSGDYYFLPYNLFSGMATKNPFIADERQSNIDFNYLQKYVVVGSISIPSGFAFEELPKNKQIILPDSSISIARTMEMNGNTVTFNLSINYLRQQYYVEEYANIKEFYKKMFALLDEKIVVRKQ